MLVIILAHPFDESTVPPQTAVLTSSDRLLTRNSVPPSPSHCCLVLIPQMTFETSAQQSSASLLQLPDPLLVAVLCCCADDPRSVCSAARAHSRLHQAAVLALSSIKLPLVQSDAAERQQRLDSLVDLYLPSHGQHVESLDLRGFSRQKRSEAVWFRLFQLPSNLTQLSSLVALSLCVQLRPSDQDLLGAAAAPPLKQLGLYVCKLDGGEEGLAAALALLPGLEHLAIVRAIPGYREGGNDNIGNFATPLRAVMPGLSKLTCLQLEPAWDDSNDPAAVLQHMTALTRLVDLRLLLVGRHGYNITASMLSGAQHVTYLKLMGRGISGVRRVSLEPAALAGKTMLQHLELCQPSGGAVGTAGTAQLLCELHQLQQLTWLALHGLQGTDAGPPAAAYTALTASSKLQRLDVSKCTVPAGVWQHVFPAGKQLPQLQDLRMSDVTFPAGPAAAPEGTRLVSCCPGLQVLRLQRLQCQGLLTALQGLSSLTSLHLWPPADSTEEWAEGLCQLTGLRDLRLIGAAEEGLLLQLTKLRQLTSLQYGNRSNVASTGCNHFHGQVSTLNVSKSYMLT